MLDPKTISNSIPPKWPFGTRQINHEEFQRQMAISAMMNRKLMFD
jgi:hypothetical protein